MNTRTILFTAITLFGSMNFSFITPDKENIIKSETSYGENYRITAKTRNTYGENYWIDLIVEATVFSGSKMIHGVFYNDDYGLKKLTYYRDYNYEESYYVVIDGNNYFFTF